MAGPGLRHLFDVFSGATELDAALARRPCLSDDRIPWLTYAQVASAVRGTLTGLSGRAGVALVAPKNDVESAIALLAAWASGSAVVLIDSAIHPTARDAIVSAFRPEIAYDPTAGLVDTGEHGEPAPPFHEILLSTSGTSGSSKFVRLPNEAVFANAHQIADGLLIGAGDVAVCHLPLHYSYGLSVLLSHLEQGAAAFLTEAKITSADFSIRLASAGATHFPGVPFHYTTLARLGLARLIPPSVTTFTQAGGRLERRFAEAIHAQATARGARLCVMYGQTEAGPRMTTLPSDRFPLKPESVGRALKGGRLEIVNETGTVLPEGQVGQIVYYGPNVMRGYATSRSCLLQGDQMNGRLETGDVGYLDRDGDLFITGRNQRFAKVAGLRIELDEVERLLRPDFEAVIIAGADCIHVFAPELDRNGGALAQRLADLANRFGLPARSFKTVQVDTIPLKDSGKVDFARLRELV